MEPMASGTETRGEQHSEAAVGPSATTVTTATTVDPRELPRAQRERRRRIVHAALDLLADHEYDAIQVRDIADAAGVALATLYRYFSSKEHLYAAVLLEWAADYPVGLDRAAGTDPEARIRALMRRAVRAFERAPHVMRVVVVLETSDDPNARALFDEFARANAAVFLDALRSLDAEIAASIHFTLNSVMVTRLRSWALGRATIPDVNRSIEQSIDLIFSASPTGVEAVPSTDA